ncbi:hypothetical protein AB0D67_38615 [Streptosporangium sp. NPDC048047]|uniref:hypothetical protein n=1 Tax=Streptosporangium sp. NPDC048047 TaxID=3155748 RepID=UPI0034132EE7
MDVPDSVWRSPQARELIAARDIGGLIEFARRAGCVGSPGLHEKLLEAYGPRDGGAELRIHACHPHPIK